MPKGVKIDSKKKAEMLKSVKGMGNAEAAKKLGISVGTLYNWRSKSGETTISKNPKIKGSKNIKAPTKTINIKKVTKAIENINASLAILETFVKIAAAA